MRFAWRKGENKQGAQRSATHQGAGSNPRLFMFGAARQNQIG